METVRVVCAYDCPDMCSLLARVENGRGTQIHPVTPLEEVFGARAFGRETILELEQRI